MIGRQILSLYYFIHFLLHDRTARSNITMTYISILLNPINETHINYVGIKRGPSDNAQYLGIISLPVKLIRNKQTRSRTSSKTQTDLTDYD